MDVIKIKDDKVVGWMPIPSFDNILEDKKRCSETIKIWEIMEAKYVKVPFDLNLAKQISSGNIEGKIWDEHNYCNVRIIDFNYNTFYGKFNVFVSEVGENSEILSVCNDYGYIYYEKTKEFDKSRVLMLKVPEYMTFKDGDVVVTDNIIVVIRNPKIDNLNGFCFKLYVACNFKEKSLFYCADFINQESARLATEEEKQILVERLKKSKQPKDEEYLKRFFPNHSNSSNTGKDFEFKPFDKVLVRDSEVLEWKIDIFREFIEDGGSEGYRYNCFYDNWNYCIPYNEQTAHLLGTTKKPE